MNFENQFELFGEAGKPTKEALRTGPEKELVTEKSLPELQAEFKTLTGFEASAYNYTDPNELKLFIDHNKNASRTEINSILIGRANELDSGLKYFQR
jgi:hypothetical protein